MDADNLEKNGTTILLETTSSLIITDNVYDLTFIVCRLERVQARVLPNTNIQIYEQKFKDFIGK